MSANEITYAVDFRVPGNDGRTDKVRSDCPSSGATGAPCAIPRIARLVALAIRFEGMLRDDTIRDYGELARLGRVTTARITQIMQLRQLAPDIQEKILFLPPIKGLNEKNLRPVVSRINWHEQRRMFQRISKG